MLNRNEKKVLNIIEENPFISQKDIADQVHLTRSTVATIISSLTQKKHLLGRAYVVNRSKDIYCIGGMNVDRKFNLIADMVLQTSNPAVSTVSVGGVARNIAENLGRLNLDVSLLSLGGYDQDFNLIKTETEPYANIQHVTQKQGFSTGMYNAILDPEGKMLLAIADMQIYEEMDVEWIAQYQNILSQAELLVLDLNLPSDTVDFILKLARKNEIDVAIIPVSSPKMSRLPRNLTGVKWMIVKEAESETYFDIEVTNEAAFQSLVDRWLEVGVENVIITRGAKESAYGNQDGDRANFLPPKVDEVVDETGADDAYASGILFGYLEGFTPEESIQLGMSNSYHFLQTPHNVRYNLTKDTLLREANTLFKKGNT